MSDLIPSRKVKFFDTATQALKTFETSVKTFGELKSVLSNLFNTDTRNGKFVLAQLKLTLELDDAMLPETDFVLTRTPVSTKSATKKLSDEQKAANAAARKKAFEDKKKTTAKSASKPIVKSTSKPVVKSTIKSEKPIAKETVKEKKSTNAVFTKLEDMSDSEIARFASNVPKR